MEILDASGKVVRTVFKRPRGAEEQPTADAGGGDEEEGGGFRRTRRPHALEKTRRHASLHLGSSLSRPVASATRPEGPNGPAAVPGKYAVRLTAGIVDLDTAAHR